VKERDRAVHDLVRAEVAAVLGHNDPVAVTMDTSFVKLGTDSLAALELRNRLSKHVGFRLEPTVIFDHPTPAALVRHLRSRVREA
jgi:mycoketide-CoA synthase